MTDFKGMAEQHKEDADQKVEKGGLLVKAVEDYRDALECRIKAVLDKQGKFDQGKGKERGDMHHELRKLAEKAGLNLKEETLSFLEQSTALKQTRNSDVTYCGTSCVINYNTWITGNPDQIEQELIAEVRRIKEVCEEIWHASASVFK